jgi:hypothetical protein
MLKLIQGCAHKKGVAHIVRAPGTEGHSRFRTSDGKAVATYVSTFDPAEKTVLRFRASVKCRKCSASDLDAALSLK